MNYQSRRSSATPSNHIPTSLIFVLLACSTCQRTHASCPALCCPCSYAAIFCVSFVCNGSRESSISTSKAFVDYSRAKSNYMSRDFDFIRTIFHMFSCLHLPPMAHNHCSSSSDCSESLNDYNKAMLWLQKSCCSQQILMTMYAHFLVDICSVFAGVSSVAHWHQYPS